MNVLKKITMISGLSVYIHAWSAGISIQPPDLSSLVPTDVANLGYNSGYAVSKSAGDNILADDCRLGGFESLQVLIKEAIETIKADINYTGNTATTFKKANIIGLIYGLISSVEEHCEEDKTLLEESKELVEQNHQLTIVEIPTLPEEAKERWSYQAGYASMKWLLTYSADSPECEREKKNLEELRVGIYKKYYQSAKNETAQAHILAKIKAIDEYIAANMCH